MEDEISGPRLTRLAQIAEIVAALGVVVSLIFVGMELEQNTEAVRAATVHDITSSSRQVLVDAALSEDLSRIRRIGEADLSALTEAERYRFFMFNRQNRLHFQNVWIQHQLGVLDDRA